MITKEEYLILYRKNLSGLCSPEEIELLNAYQDNIELVDTCWDEKGLNKQDVQDRIWQRLTESRKTTEKRVLLKPVTAMFLKIAAMLILVTSITLFFFKSNFHKSPSSFPVTTVRYPNIHSGGNQAILTMADGSTITLASAKNGKLVTQHGVQICKEKDGMLTYHFNSDKGSTGNDGNNTITTPRGGQYEVVLSDGTKVWLNAASSLRFPVAFAGSCRNVTLTGEAYFEVAKNKHKPFLLKANGTNIQVLGTHFNVSAYSDDAAVTTTLLEGSVRLVKDATVAMLKPGEMGTSLNNQTAIRVRKADIEKAMAWKNGYFLFDNTDIRIIMKQAARWYDVDVVYQGSVNKSFGGKISKYKNIDELLKNLELTGTIQFKVEGRRVTVIQ
ncbi:FecR family protein [Pedobacter sp. L105]|uniref:FecR family protein n=1 Tax=Pedobacter sp. L105 TaxID=1641871 RepID=UPI00131DB72C|nr:FecR family protein [Pedobacter sp. L105]